MNIEEYLEFPESQKELRRKNLETILKYVCCRDEERKERYKLFTEDGIGGYTGPGVYKEPLFVEWGMPGHEGLKGSDEWNYECFPNCEYTDIRVMQTQDPNYFIVAAAGGADINFPAYEKRPYKNYFFHVFEMEDGLIKCYHEHMNFCQVFHTLGIELPEVKFPGK